MTDLRHALHALVERPPAQPLALDVLVARGDRLRRRRRLWSVVVAFALMAVASVGAVSLVLQNPREEVVLATGGRTSAGYIAERAGGYVAAGTWNLTITRGAQVIELSSSSSDHCGRTGLILPGDEVRGTIAGLGSTLRVGERFTCPE